MFPNSFMDTLGGVFVLAFFVWFDFFFLPGFHILVQGATHKNLQGLRFFYIS